MEMPFVRLSLPAMYFAAALSLQAGDAAMPDVPTVKASEDRVIEKTVPVGAEVALRTKRQEYLLGEDIEMDFIVTNKGDTPFTIHFGGDFRAERPLRFKVTATDAAGKAAEDPDPNPTNMGGSYGSRILRPGESWTQPLRLLEYRRFDRPGTYTIRATHDLGWAVTTRPLPVAETTITLRMPDAAQATEIVEKFMSTPDNTLSPVGRDHREISRLMRYPVYLTPLSRRAWTGDYRATWGISAMETPYATEELIKLLDHPDGMYSFWAALSLRDRLPNYDRPGQIAYDDGYALRKRLVAAGWDARFAPAVREHARLLLTKNERAFSSMAGEFLEAIGEPSDLPYILAALDRDLSIFEDRKNPEDDITDASNPVKNLRYAAMAIALSSGQSAKPDSLATELLWLDTLPSEAANRPPSWEKQLVTLLRSPCPVIREKAVLRLPSPLPAAFRPHLIAAFSDPDLGVQKAACEWVRASKDATFRSQVLEALGTARNKTHFRAASEAAYAIGEQRAALQANIALLEDRPRIVDVLDTLAFLAIADFRRSFFCDPNRPAEELREIKAAWQTFIDTHAAEIATGTRFSAGSPQIPPALFRDALRLQLEDGREWPGIKP